MFRRMAALMRVVVAAGVPVLLLSACEGTPAGLDHQEVSVELEQTVLQAWSQLPAEEGVDLQLRSALPAEGEGGWGLQWSSLLTGGGEEARAAGDAGAGLLVAEGRLMMAEAAVEAFGTSWAAAQVSGVAAVLAAVEQAAGPTGLRGEQASLVGEARTAVAAASASAGVGEALAASLGASEALRMLAPETAAAEAILWAKGLLERAEAAAAGIPAFEDALTTSARHLASAIEAFDAGRWREAVKQARSSAAISRRVLGAVAMEERPGNVEEAAQRALQVATELYVEAEAAVGTGGTEAQLRLLGEARRLLDEGQDRFTAGDFPQALRLAVRSASISRRLLHAGTVPGGTQAGAERAIRVATELFATVQEKLGTGGTAAQQEALERARRLLDAAGTALEAGEPAKAIRLAVEAATLCRRLLISLR
jgi:hypothetical protein